MTPFEYASIGIAILSVGAIFLQLRNMTESIKKAAEANKLSNVMVVIQLEQSVADARMFFHQAVDEVAKLAEQTPKPSPETIKRLEHNRNVAREQYLNTMDRLCTCIIRGYVDEKEYREDYRRSITDIIDKFPEKFNADTRHRNIKHIHEKWSAGESATKQVSS